MARQRGVSAFAWGRGVYQPHPARASANWPEIMLRRGGMDQLAAALAASPELFPHALDLRSGTVTLLRLSSQAYEQASFLDGRLAGVGNPGRTLPIVELAAAVSATGLTESTWFIFHIGHVGSTLMSRLLGRHPTVFSLREPDILRTLAQSPALAATYLPVFLKLWSRGWEPGVRSVVKVSSFVSDLSTLVLARDYAPRAIFMGVPPEVYLATIFGGANTPMEARALAPVRLARLRARLGCHWQLEEMSMGEVAALGWACEASALAASAAQFGTRIHVLNFEGFLTQPRQHLRAAFAHFDIAASETEIAEILAGPEMRTYSKAPEHSYDAALRQSVLNEGRARFSTEIRHGLSWLDRVAKEYPQIADALPLF